MLVITFHLFLSSAIVMEVQVLCNCRDPDTGAASMHHFSGKKDPSKWFLYVML